MSLFVPKQASAVEPRVVVVFGDSITAGNQLPPAEHNHAWVNLVQERSQGKLQLVNEGQGGRPTASVQEFDQMLTRNPHADMLVLALGTNDSRDIKADCVPKAVNHLRAMIERARKTYGQNLSILLVGPPNIRKDALGPTRPIAQERDAKIRELGAGFEKLAVEVHCDFVSLCGALPPESLAKDGVHPDAAGNEAIAAVILPKLLTLAAPDKQLK